MLIPAITYLTIRCPSCGRLQGKMLSFFACGVGKEAQVNCSCRAPLLTYGTRDGKSFWLHLHCVMCEGQHLLHVPRNHLFSTSVTPLFCETTGLEVGFVGPKERVKEATRWQERSLRELVQDLGFGDYFSNPEVMYRVLHYLHQLALSGNLYCHCGNTDIEVEIFPDHLELHCPECEASGKVMAESKEDLLAVKRIGEIELVGRGFRCRRVSRTRGRPGHSSKKQ